MILKALKYWLSRANLQAYTVLQLLHGAEAPHDMISRALHIFMEIDKLWESLDKAVIVDLGAGATSVDWNPERSGADE